MLGILMFSSCSSTDYANAMPSSCTALMKFDASKMKSENVADAMRMLLPIDEVKDCGIDFGSNVYLFETVDGNIGLCAKVKDTGDLEELFDALANEGKSSKLRKQGGNWLTDVNGSWAVAFSGKSLLVLGPVASASIPDTQRFLVRMLKQDEDKSIVAKPIFEKVNAMPNAVALVAQVQALPEKMVAPFTIGMPSGADASQVLIAAGIEKEDGLLVFNGESFSFDASLDKSIKTSNEVYRKIGGKYLSLIPGNSFFSLYTNIDGQKFLPMLQVSKSMQTLLVGLNTAIDFDNIIRSIDGDFVLTTNSLSSDNIDMTFFAQVKNPTWVADVDYWKKSCPRGSSLSGDLANGWTYASGTTKMFFGLREGKDFYCTSNEKNDGRGLPSGERMSQELTKKMSDARLAMVLNIKALSATGVAPKGVSDAMDKLLGNTEAIVYIIK